MEFHGDEKGRGFWTLDKEKKEKIDPDDSDDSGGLDKVYINLVNLGGKKNP